MQYRLLIIVLFFSFFIKSQTTLDESKKAVDTLFYTNAEAALTLSEKQLPLAFEKNDTTLITYFLDQAGELNRMFGNYDKAIDQLNKCLSYKEKWDDLKDLSITHNNLGKTYGQKGMYEMAVYHFLEALKLMETSDNLLGQSFYLNNLGAMYDLQHNYNMSLVYYKKALKIKEKLGNRPAIAASLTNLGITYFNLGDIELALKNHKEAYRIYKNGDKPNKWIRTINNIGEIYIALNDGETAVSYLEIAVTNDSLITDQKLRMNIINNYAHALFLSNNLSAAKKKLNEGLALAKESNSYSILAQVYRLKSIVAEAEAKKQDDNTLYLESLHFLRKSIAFNDSMINESNIRSVAEMQGKYVYEKQLRTISENKLYIAEKEKQIEKNKAAVFLWSGVSIVFFLVIMILFALYLFKQKNNRLLKGQFALIDRQKSNLEELNENIKKQLDKTVITLKDKDALLENIFSKSSDKELPEELLSLSKREMEVLSYLALGWSDDMLAEKLFVSKSTIKTHLRRIYSKLLVRGRAEAVSIAHKYNILGENLIYD